MSYKFASLYGGLNFAVGSKHCTALSSSIVEF